MQKVISSKTEFYKLSKLGLLGNHLRQWSWEEFKESAEGGWSGIPEIVGVRHVRQSFTNKGISGLMPKNEAYQYGEKCIQSGESSDNLLFDEGAVHDRLTIQGEAMTCEQHLYLRYSYLQCHQRTLWQIDNTGSLAGLKRYQYPHNVTVLKGGRFVYIPRSAGIGKQGCVVSHVTGLQASLVLQTYMDACSWDKLNEIFDEYKTPVVEFACFDRAIGVLGWNTLFWEVRNKY